MSRNTTFFLLTCGFCNQALETLHHVFFACQYTAYIWQLFKLKLGFSNYNIGSLEEAAGKILQSFKGKHKQNILARATLNAVIWHIWKERNEWIFQHKARHKIILFRSIYEDIREIMKNCSWQVNSDRDSLAVLLNWDVWAFWGNIFVQIMYSCLMLIFCSYSSVILLVALGQSGLLFGVLQLMVTVRVLSPLYI